MVVNDKIKLIDEKQFSFHRKRVARFLYDRGIVFLGFKINCTYNEKGLILNHSQALLRAEDLIKRYVTIELPSLDLIDFCSLSMKVLNDPIKSVFVYGLVGYRPLIEFNESVIYRIKEGFYIEPSLSVFYLEDFCSVSNFWDVLVEDAKQGLDLKNFYIRSFRGYKNESIFVELQQFLSPPSLVVPGSWALDSNFDFYKNHRDAHIDGLNFRILKDRSVILIHLIKVFMEENKMFISDGWIYQKDFNDSTIEYKVTTIDNFFDLAPIIVGFLYHRFPYQLEPTFINLLILEHSEIVLRRIKQISSLIPQRFPLKKNLQPFIFPNRCNELSVDGVLDLGPSFVLK